MIASTARRNTAFLLPLQGAPFSCNRIFLFHRVQKSCQVLSCSSPSGVPPPGSGLCAPSQRLPESWAANTFELACPAEKSSRVPSPAFLLLLYRLPAPRP